MNVEPLQLVLTFDAEADVFDPSIAAGSLGGGGWRGIEEGIPLIVRMLAGYRDSRGARLRSTWFVRTDGEIAPTSDDAAWLLRQHGGLWADRVAAGDEIGFHLHFSKRAQADCSGERLRGEIQDALRAVKTAGFSPVCARLGEAFGANAAMAALVEAGFQVDSTAMPGRVRRDADRCFDWDGTPDGPYHPSVDDYRRPGMPEHPLLEVPMSMVPVQAEYDLAPMRRYVDLSFRHAALRAGLRDLLATASCLVTVTHPSTILPGIMGRRHGLLSFEAAEFQQNLAFIFAECARLGREVHSITLKEWAPLFVRTGETVLVS